MKKSKDKVEAEDEKKIINELWRKSNIDNNEYGLLIGGNIRFELEGDENEISDKTWAKAKWLLLDNPKTVFTFYHTHTEWDCPLSGDDIAVFLRHKNLQTLIAITMETVYSVTKTEDTKHIEYTKYQEAVAEFKKKTKKIIYSEEVGNNCFSYLNSYREVLCNAAKQMAKDHSFLYEER